MGGHRIYDLETEGYPCVCGHSMGAHNIAALSYSEIVESSAEFPCDRQFGGICNCTGYTPAAAAIGEADDG